MFADPMTPERQRLRDATDAAVIAHRNNPTPENRAALMAAAEASNRYFMETQTVEFQTRTHEAR